MAKDIKRKKRILDEILQINDEQLLRDSRKQKERNERHDRLMRTSTLYRFKELHGPKALIVVIVILCMSSLIFNLWGILQ